jgi:hypothetical protein
MLHWMSGKTRRDKFENNTVKESCGSTYSMVKNMFRWFGLVGRISIDDVV